MISSFPTGNSVQSPYWYNQVAKTILVHENVLALTESLNAEHTRSIRLGISRLDDIGLYTATTEELTTLTRVAKTFWRTRTSQVPSMHLHSAPEQGCFWGSWSLSLSIILQTLLRNLLSFWTRLCTILAWQAFPCCRRFSAAYLRIAMTKRTWEEHERFCLKVVSVGLSKTCKWFARTLIPLSRRCR